MTDTDTTFAAATTETPAQLLRDRCHSSADYCRVPLNEHERRRFKVLLTKVVARLANKIAASYDDSDTDDSEPEDTTTPTTPTTVPAAAPPVASPASSVQPSAPTVTKPEGTNDPLPLIISCLLLVIGVTMFVQYYDDSALLASAERWHERTDGEYFRVHLDTATAWTLYYADCCAPLRDAFRVPTDGVIVRCNNSRIAMPANVTAYFSDYPTAVAHAERNNLTRIYATDGTCGWQRTSDDEMLIYGRDSTHNLSSRGKSIWARPGPFVVTLNESDLRATVDYYRDPWIRQALWERVDRDPRWSETVLGGKLLSPAPRSVWGTYGGHLSWRQWYHRVLTGRNDYQCGIVTATSWCHPLPEPAPQATSPTTSSVQRQMIYVTVVQVGLITMMTGVSLAHILWSSGAVLDILIFMGFTFGVFAIVLFA